LLNEIESKANAFKTNYVFLDEIQEIKDFEKCIITLFEHQNLKFDIYLTGSNSHMFSSELITLFTGRTYELTLFPFSFKEIIENNIINSEWELNKKFEYYIMHGGMGIIIDRYNNSEKVFEILKSVYDSIFTKDLMNRHHIKNIDSITKIAKFIFNHIGRNISANNLENYLVSNKEIKISKVTILNYFM
jgi:predicted AAA+ superfamily ATPase